VLPGAGDAAAHVKLLSRRRDAWCAMIDSLFVMNEAGEVLIEKHSRRRHPRAVCETFFDHVRKEARPEDTCPIIATPDCYLIHILRYKLFFIAALAREAPPMMVIEFLQRTVEVLYDYFGGPVGEVVMKENFVTVYSVLDEMLDNGYPLITELNILQEMIKPKSATTRIADALSVSGQGASRSTGELPGGAMSDVPWRKAGVKYTNNELFFDIIEEIDGTMDWCASFPALRIEEGCAWPLVVDTLALLCRPCVVAATALRSHAM
jgi:AP-3 complex subunit mu